MLREIPSTLQWLVPWEPLDHNGQVFDIELQREIGPTHVLFDVTPKAIAKRVDFDDVLFAIEHPKYALAVVHLTWSARREASNLWPDTTMYRDWQDWIDNQMIPDHREYSDFDMGDG